MNKPGPHGRGRIVWALWAVAIVLSLAALHPGFRHLAQTAVGPHRDQIRLPLLLIPLIITLLACARNWKGWRKEWRALKAADLKHLFPLIPLIWAVSIAGPFLWALAFAWGVVFVPLGGLYRKLFGGRPSAGWPEEWRHVTLNERQAQAREAQRVLSPWLGSWLGPLLFLAVAGAAAVATHTRSSFPVAAANLIVSFWANGLSATCMLAIGSKMDTWDVSAEIAMLKRIRVLGLATAVIGAGLLVAAWAERQT